MNNKKSFNDEVREIHKNSLIVDAHCDTLLSTMKDSMYRMAEGKETRHLREKSSKGHLDFPRLKKGGVNCQIFAAFLEPPYYPVSVQRALQMIQAFYRETEMTKNLIHTMRYSEITENFNQEKISALLFFEGGEAIDGGYIGDEPDLRVLKIMYKLGVRGITLTWNYRNKIANGVQEQDRGGRLTNFGEAVVKEMNELGMVVDVSHLSDASFWDVIEVSNEPIIASHSDCRALSPVSRNLNDEQLKAIHETNGVVGINFAPTFLNKEKVAKGEQPTVQDAVDHIDHIVEVAGIDHVGLGSDFDGIRNTPKGLEDVSKIPNITNELLNRGYTHQDIEKILGKNFLRVFREVLA